jgi:spoIIIJ-associated protein
VVEWVETTGRTVAEALEAALDQLGVDERDAEVVIVEEPKSGLFGLRKSEARVRARVRPTRPRPKRQQRDRRSRGRDNGPRSESGSRGNGDGPRSGERAAATSGSAGARAELPSDGDGGSGRGDGEDGAPPRARRRRGGRGTGVTAADGGTGAEPDLGSEDTTRAAGRSGGASAGGRASRKKSGGREATAETTSNPEEEQMSVEEQAQLAERFVTGVVECFGLGGTTTVTIDEPMVEVAVEGDGLGILIGPHGATLAALQDLTRTVVQRRGVDHGTRIVVDVSGYRAKRAAALAEFTRSVATEVLSSGRPHSLEPMSASDRKIVHDTVNDIDGVATSSQGEEEHRHVVIHPASTSAAPSESAVVGAAAGHDDAEGPDGE